MQPAILLSRQAALDSHRFAGAAFLYASTLLEGRVAIASDSGNCERMDTSEFPSADGRWVVRVYGKVCDLGLVSLAAVLVDLARSGLSDQAVTVLSVDMPSDSSLWPRPEWESSSKLNIRLPSNANVALQMAAYQGVQIQVRFCATDPGERDRWLAFKAARRKWIEDMAKWARERQVNPSNAGPKPVQPEPPKASASDIACQP
jgi:hypothetical protein